MRVTGVRGPNHIVGLPEELGPSTEALHFTQEGASRLARELCAAGWTAWWEPAGGATNQTIGAGSNNNPTARA